MQNQTYSWYQVNKFAIQRTHVIPVCVQVNVSSPLIPLPTLHTLNTITSSLGGLLWSSQTFTQLKVQDTMEGAGFVLRKYDEKAGIC